jgi:hypothetical protein
MKKEDITLIKLSLIEALARAMFEKTPFSYLPEYAPLDSFF